MVDRSACDKSMQEQLREELLALAKKYRIGFTIVLEPNERESIVTPCIISNFSEQIAQIMLEHGLRQLKCRAKHDKE